MTDAIRLGEKGVDHHGDFVIAWDATQSHVVQFYVHETAEIDGVQLCVDDRDDVPSATARSEPYEGGHVLEGGLKWDGCVNMSQRDAETCLHFCGPESDPRLGRIMRAVYDLGRRAGFDAWRSR